MTTLGRSGTSGERVMKEGESYIEPVFGKRRAWQQSAAIYEELRRPDYFALSEPALYARATTASPSYIWRDAGFVRVQGAGIPKEWTVGVSRVLVFEQDDGIELLLPGSRHADLIALEGVRPAAWDRILNDTMQPLAFELKASTVGAFDRIAGRVRRITSNVTAVKNDALRVLGKADGLVSLDLRFADGLSDAGFGFAQSFSALTELALPRSFLGLGLRNLARDAPLQRLHRQCMNMEDPPDALFSYAELQSIVELDVAVSRPSAGALEALGRLRKLRMLALTVGGATVRVSFLRNLRDLRALRLSLDTLHDSAELAEALRELPRLEELSLNAPVDDRVLEALYDHPCLRCLRIAPPTVTEKPKRLGLSKSALAQLGRIRSLRELRLDGATLDERSLEGLSGVSGLARLSFGGSPTAETIQRLGALPRLLLLQLGSINLQAARALARLHRSGWSLCQLRFARAASDARATLRRAFGKGLENYGHESVWNTTHALAREQVFPSAAA